MATPFNCYSFSNGIIIASGKLWDHNFFFFFLVTVLFVKTKELSVKKSAFLLHPIFAIFCGKSTVAF